LDALVVVGIQVTFQFLDQGWALQFRLMLLLVCLLLSATLLAMDNGSFGVDGISCGFPRQSLLTLSAMDLDSTICFEGLSIGLGTTFVTFGDATTNRGGCSFLSTSGSTKCTLGTVLVSSSLSTLGIWSAYSCVVLF
jgi:hypothetical protein